MHLQNKNTLLALILTTEWDQEDECQSDITVFYFHLTGFGFHPAVSLEPFFVGWDPLMPGIFALCGICTLWCRYLS